MLRIWSAGCSLGMEPYTLAIVMSEYQEKNPAFNWRILATDISTQALQKAVKAIYEEERVNCIPFNMKSKYLLRSKDRKKKLIRIVPELPQTCGIQAPQLHGALFLQQRDGYYFLS